MRQEEKNSLLNLPPPAHYTPPRFLSFSASSHAPPPNQPTRLAGLFLLSSKPAQRSQEDMRPRGGQRSEVWRGFPWEKRCRPQTLPPAAARARRGAGGMLFTGLSLEPSPSLSPNPCNETQNSLAAGLRWRRLQFSPPADSPLHDPSS